MSFSDSALESGPIPIKKNFDNFKTNFKIDLAQKFELIKKNECHLGFNGAALS